MKLTKGLKAVAVAVLGVAMASATAKAQISVQLNIGPQPVCPYGYFDYPPYQCAPFGYYGPTWFVNGVFLGAGPWFHGPVGFRGYIDHRYDPHFGYHGPFPHRGERADWGHHRGWEHNWHGTERRAEQRHDNVHHEQQRPHGNPHDDHKHPESHPDHHGHPDHPDHDRGRR